MKTATLELGCRTDRPPKGLRTRIMSDPTDHFCPVAWADAHGPLAPDGTPMDRIPTR